MRVSFRVLWANSGGELPRRGERTQRVRAMDRVWQKDWERHTLMRSTQPSLYSRAVHHFTLVRSVINLTAVTTRDVGAETASASASPNAFNSRLAVCGITQ